ncbi:RES family NAD+ phosphorylase [Actinomadura sp. 9N215]|uniref:RES family NAD+ phosphorylase n=1 Tax=Actinomadura sp. 9N215 TaxID=3375150 RepID=UPI00378EAC21
MPPQEPPENYGGTPNFHHLEAGTVLYRIHDGNRTAADFSDRLARSPFKGGRFDSVPGHEYRYWYAGTNQTTAVAERLLRDIPFGSTDHRFLPRAELAGRVLSTVETTVDLTLVSLIESKDLAAVCQDTWLVHSGAYAETRYWGQWLRRQATDAAGFIWQSRYDIPHSSLVLFGDRCDAKNVLACPPDDSFALDTPAGIARLNVLLEPYNASIEP